MTFQHDRPDLLHQMLERQLAQTEEMMAALAAEVRRQARIGARAKGFVVSTGSPFPLDTNPRLIDTLVSTAHTLTN